MFTYNDFKDSLLPGNYALTKSMELTKIKSSGTLWYTKKFIVLYYYVFLSKDLMTREYITKVNEAFDNYISGLDEEVKDSARAFFFPPIDSINFHSVDFKTFSSFVGNFEFETQAQKNDHYQRAKKCYFMMLMDAGGQTGVKKKLKEYVQSNVFVYSRENIDRTMIECAVDVCTENINGNSHRITDNSIKYLISDTAIDLINDLDTSEEISRSEIESIINANPKADPRYTSIENDMVAFIRNERQILYYYGYFHSKTSGATDFEFSSLTPVGSMSIKANALEFQAIWEHQKVKMISQPPTATINDINTTMPDKFAISYTPYTDIIGGMLRRHQITLEEYKFVVSRRNHNFIEQDWVVMENNIIEELPEIKLIIEGFLRRGDKTDEDGRKELLKYLLGIRSDMSKDDGTNSLGMCEFKNNKVTCTSESKLQLIYDIYSKLNMYRMHKYGELFERCESDLRRRYVAEANNNSENINPQVKIDWDLYNIKFDKIIMLGVIFVSSAISCNALNGVNSSEAELRHIYEYALNNFRNVLKYFGIKSNSKIKTELRKLCTSIQTGDFSQYFVEEERDNEILATYRAESSTDLMEKIKNISEVIEVGEEKERNMNLIKLIKSYYMAVYLNNDTLKCECCGNEAFITERNEPYVEFHHLIPFKEADGPDHYLNLFALCPNCHRKIHHLRIDAKSQLFEDISNNNYYSLKIVDRLKQLKEEHILESYHLEYLLAQNAITEEQYNDVAA